MILAIMIAAWVPCTQATTTPENEARLQQPAVQASASTAEGLANDQEPPAEAARAEESSPDGANGGESPSSLQLPAPLRQAFGAACETAFWKAPLDVALLGRLLSLRVSAFEERPELQPKNRREAALRAALIEENSAPGAPITSTLPLGSTPSQVTADEILNRWRLSPDFTGSTSGSSGELSNRGPRMTAELIWNAATASAPPPGTKAGLRGGPTVGTPGLWKLTLEDTGTGWKEDFLLQVPSLPGITAAEARPLLVAFHAFAITMFDIPVNTDYPDEAEARGWYLLAPLSASRFSTASREGQINTRLALEFVINRYAIDLSRIYGVGFSGGGGNALNFAARSTDCSGPVFAGIVNHTGTLSQEHSFTHACGPTGASCTGINAWEFWFGDTPQVVPFEYHLSSLLDVPYVAGFPGPAPASDPLTSMASNLVHLPILSHWALGDPNDELIVQNEAFEAHMQALGSTKHVTQTVSSNDHLWQTLSAHDACNWLSQFTAEAPKSGSSLGYEDGRIFHFEIEQDVSDAFSPFTWSFDEKRGELAIEDTANLEQIALDLTAAGFQLQTTGLAVRLRPGDGTTDQVVLEGVTTPPTGVLRDGTTLNAPWAYNSAMQRLTLWENDGAMAHAWAITF